MDSVVLPLVAQNFLDLYIQGAGAVNSTLAAESVSPGIRNRLPATVSLPPEYTPTPNGLDQTSFPANSGPEPFAQPYLYLDRCALQRAIVTAESATELHIEFFFVTQWPPLNFDPTINQPVCLPSSAGEPEAIVSECVNRLCDFLGTDGSLVGTAQDPTFPAISTEIQLLTLAEFQLLPGG